MVQLALVAVLVGAPYGAFVGDRWATPEPQHLFGAGHASDSPAPVATAELIARAATVARALTPAPPAPTATPAPTAPPAAPAARPPQPTPAAVVAGTLSGGSWVNASWYGPGFYGNRTACGQNLNTSSWGIAHKTLRCGTTVHITYRGRTVTVPVIDRGPYVAGREVDLSSAVAGALGFAGVQPIYLTIP